MKVSLILNLAIFFLIGCDQKDVKRAESPELETLLVGNSPTKEILAEVQLISVYRKDGLNIESSELVFQLRGDSAKIFVTRFARLIKFFSDQMDSSEHKIVKVDPHSYGIKIQSTDGRFGDVGISKIDRYGRATVHIAGSVYYLQTDSVLESIFECIE